jgi:hypothetical protein
MQIESLKSHLKAEPFRVFNIVLATGDRIEVRHPEMVALGGRTAVVVQPDDRMRAIDVGLIVELVTEPTATAGPKAAKKKG